MEGEDIPPSHPHGTAKFRGFYPAIAADEGAFIARRSPTQRIFCGASAISRSIGTINKRALRFPNKARRTKRVFYDSSTAIRDFLRGNSTRLLDNSSACREMLGYNSL